ncbi:MAG: MerR family transcriptional regulator [Deltaproteobacteria bacterium]|nr:MerR family transcriptional regulator [Deltaproteobacteria bacterium]
MATYSMQEVSELTEVAPWNIKYWSDMNYLGKVKRLKIGNIKHRRFTELHVMLIKKINDYLAQGHTLGASVERAKGDMGIELDKD